MNKLLKNFIGCSFRKIKSGVILSVVIFISACEPVDNEDGDNLSLCFDYFQACVSPLLNTPFAAGGTCAQSGCHLIGGGGGGSFHVETTGNIDSFTSTFAMTDLFDKDNSRLLFMPNNPAHTGGVYPALAVGQPCHSQLREWLDIVTTEQPADQRPNDPCTTMPICSVPDATTC